MVKKVFYYEKLICFVIVFALGKHCPQIIISYHIFNWTKVIYKIRIILESIVYILLKFNEY